MLFGSLCGLNSSPSLISAAAAGRENIGPIIEDFKFQITLWRMGKNNFNGKVEGDVF